MAFTAAKITQTPGWGPGALGEELHYIDFATSGDSSGEVPTDLHWIYGAYFMPLEAPDGNFYIDELSNLQTENFIDSQTNPGKILPIASAGAVTAKRSGSLSAGMAGWLVLKGMFA